MRALSLALLWLIRSLWHTSSFTNSDKKNGYPRDGSSWLIIRTPTESLPRLHLTAWELRSPADRRHLQILKSHYTVMDISGQILGRLGGCPADLRGLDGIAGVWRPCVGRLRELSVALN